MIFIWRGPIIILVRHVRGMDDGVSGGSREASLCAMCRGFLTTKDVSEDTATVFCRGFLIELQRAAEDA